MEEGGRQLKYNAGSNNCVFLRIYETMKMLDPWTGASWLLLLSFRIEDVDVWRKMKLFLGNKIKFCKHT